MRYAILDNVFGYILAVYMSCMLSSALICVCARVCVCVCVCVNMFVCACFCACMPVHMLFLVARLYPTYVKAQITLSA
jgi:hypothetical protein